MLTHLIELHWANLALISMCLSAMILLAACSSDSKDDTSTLSLAITDAPVDNATNVFVQFTSMEFHPANGSSILVPLDEPRNIDLLALQGSQFETLVDNLEVPAGNYNWVRLGVNANSGEMDSYINFKDGSSFSLYIPSGSQNGLKINRNFVVPAGGNISLTVDFDLRKSVTNPVGQVDDYFLKPVLKMTDNSQTGTIEGSVASALFEDESCDEGKAVYLYIGSDVVADDIGSPTAPLTTGLLNYNADSDRWDFEIGFVEAGEHTITATCDADIDELLTDEIDWGVVSSANVTVIAGSVIQIDLD